MATYGRGSQHWIFLDSGPFTSERVLCSGSGYVLVLWCMYVCWGEGSEGMGTGGETGSRCSWRPKFSSLHMLQLHDLQFWSLVSEKQLSVLLNRTGPFEAISVVTSAGSAPSSKACSLTRPLPLLGLCFYLSLSLCLLLASEIYAAFCPALVLAQLLPSQGGLSSTSLLPLPQLSSLWPCASPLFSLLTMLSVFLGCLFPPPRI